MLSPYIRPENGEVRRKRTQSRPWCNLGAQLAQLRTDAAPWSIRRSGRAANPIREGRVGVDRPLGLLRQVRPCLSKGARLYRFGGGWIDNPAHLADSVGREPTASRVLPHEFGVGCDVDAVDLVIGYIALHPLHLWSQIP